MAEAQTDDDIDDVADKAAEIGKELGVEGNKPPEQEEDDLIDYDVVEEGQEDAVIAKERKPAAGGEAERKQLSNKEKRALRKKNIARKFGEKDAAIAMRDDRIAQLEGRINNIDSRFANVDRQKIDDGINQSASAYNAAKDAYSKAFAEGDGAAATEAMEKMYNHKQQYDKLNDIKTQLGNAPKNSGPQPNEAVMNRAKSWAEKNSSWYNVAGGDEDSDIAKALSGTLQAEGLDPKTDKFWKELDRRLELRGIGERDDLEGDDDEDEIEEKQERKPATPRKRPSPPVSGGSGRGDIAGKVRVVLPTEYVKHLKDKGWWDNPEMKKKMIKSYLDNKKLLTAQG